MRTTKPFLIAGVPIAGLALHSLSSHGGVAAVKAIRNAAQSYFGGRRDPNNNGAWGIERVDLGELLSADTGWNEELNDALIKSVYPTVRSGWANHDCLFSCK